MLTIQDIAKRHIEWVKMANYLGADYAEDVVQDVIALELWHRTRQISIPPRRRRGWL